MYNIFIFYILFIMKLKRSIVCIFLIFILYLFQPKTRLVMDVKKSRSFVKSQFIFNFLLSALNGSTSNKHVINPERKNK